VAIGDSLAELAELARSAGAAVVGSTSQRLNRPTHQYAGSGKV
jgi:50S ribosomal subunit-associated GTPase HflX